MLITTAVGRVYRGVFGAPPAAVDEGEASGLVLVADGIGGLDLCAAGMRHMVARRRPDVRVEPVAWCHGFGRWHRDLTDRRNVEAHAEAVAGRVRRFLEAGPGRPVALVGKSGGCGVVLGALERLGPGAVEAAVLIAPAVSPGYDLGRALGAVRREMVVFWSPLDVFLLGAGTCAFGTIDGVRGPAAGLVGFRAAGLDAGVAARLRQERWGWRMASTGYLGGHVGSDSPWFLGRFVVPVAIGADGSEGEWAGVKRGAGRADNTWARRG
jgi:hypothetical protein